MTTVRLRRLGTLVVLAATLAVAPGSMADRASAAATVPVPTVPVTVPAGIEEFSPYLPQDTCDPTDKPGTLALARLLTATYPDTSIIATSYACGTDGTVSEHYEGRAVDWAINASSATQVAEAHALLSWLFGADAAGVPAGNARRLGVMYAIYDAQIIGTYNLGAGWRPTACTGVTGCHRDHVHLSLSWAGARGATSWWTGSVAPVDYGPCRAAGFALAATPATAAPNPTPCPAVAAPGPAPSGAPAALVTLRSWSGATLAAGVHGPVVAALQTSIGVTADGSFGPATTAALQAFQTAHGLPATGVTDAGTWSALLGLSATPAAAVPPAAGMVVAGKVAAGKAVAGKVAAGKAVAGTVTPLKPVRPVLRLGSHGISVKLVQSLLRVRVTGLYSPTTGNAVRRYQRRRHLPIDGIVGPRTWHALGR